MLKLAMLTIFYLGLVFSEEGNAPRQARGGIEAIRLVNGITEREGRLEVLSQGVWGTICDDRFDDNVARVICRSLSFPLSNGSNSGYVGASYRYYGVVDDETAILLDEVVCLGTESSLNECIHNAIGHNDCTHSEDVGVICDRSFQQIIDVRLVDGQTTSEGRVEVLVTATWGAGWGTVCSSNFTDGAATVVCRMLGIESNASHVVWTIGFGPGYQDTHILLDNVVCFGNETSINECAHNAVGDHSCRHNADVGIICGRMIPEVVTQVRLVNGFNPQEGRLEVLVNGTWGTVCDDRFCDHAARVVCRMLGFPVQGTVSVRGAGFGQGTGPILLDQVSCRGDEYHLDSCIYETLHDCYHDEDIGVRCGSRLPGVVTQVRLMNGSNPQEGRLEVLVNGTWGSVCDDMFYDDAARVVCRMLVFPFIGAVAVRGAGLGQGTGPILLDNVECRGNETTLDDCVFETHHDCHHRDDVGVRCAE